MEHGKRQPWLRSVLCNVARDRGWCAVDIDRVEEKLLLAGGGDVAVLRAMLRSPDVINARLRSHGFHTLRVATVFAIAAALESYLVKEAASEQLRQQQEQQQQQQEEQEQQRQPHQQAAARAGSPLRLLESSSPRCAATPAEGAIPFSVSVRTDPSDRNLGLRSRGPSAHPTPQSTLHQGAAEKSSTAQVPDADTAAPAPAPSAAAEPPTAGTSEAPAAADRALSAAAVEPCRGSAGSGSSLDSGGSSSGPPEDSLNHLSPGDRVDYLLRNPETSAVVRARLPQCLLDLQHVARARQLHIVLVPLSVLYFYQNSAARTFQDGRSLQSTLDELRSGEASPYTIPLMMFQLVCSGRKPARLYSVNNRRLFCYHYVYGKERPDLLIPGLWNGTYANRGDTGGLPQGNDTDLPVLGCVSIDGTTKGCLSRTKAERDVDLEALCQQWRQRVLPEKRVVSKEGGVWLEETYHWPKSRPIPKI
eukprot:TRINITY_DN8939_c0_g1_i1.p1 TRINITY_DN8939_c0_g1~~TRINITY_DN8939_c0_g1_i1.p1  ORF type:complete len:522 (+),score=89.32 TRINITY_DN8939_c0_g1_i1:139-1566(+)